MPLPRLGVGSIINNPEMWLIVDDLEGDVLYSNKSFRKVRAKLEKLEKKATENEKSNKSYSLWFGDDWEEYEEDED